MKKLLLVLLLAGVAPHVNAHGHHHKLHDSHHHKGYLTSRETQKPMHKKP